MFYYDDYDEEVDWNDPQSVELEIAQAIMLLANLIGPKATVERVAKISSDVQRIYGLN